MAPVAEVTPQKLAAAVEGNLVAWYSHHACLPGFRLLSSRDARLLSSGQAGNTRIAIRLRFNTKTVDRQLDDIIGDCRELQVSAGFWVGPNSKPSDLGHRLRSRGLLCRKRCVAMACHIHEIEDAVPRPEELRIQLLDDYSIFEDGRVEHPTIGKITTTLRRGHLEANTRTSRIRPQRIWHFMAYLENKPVGASTLHIGSGVAGIYDVGVVKGARRQGIGAAVTHYACKFAQDLGHDIAVLLASRMGTGMYHRLGFADVCPMSYWYLPKASPKGR